MFRVVQDFLRTSMALISGYCAFTRTIRLGRFHTHAFGWDVGGELHH